MHTYPHYKHIHRQIQTYKHTSTQAYRHNPAHTPTSTSPYKYPYHIHIHTQIQTHKHSPRESHSDTLTITPIQTKTPYPQAPPQTHGHTRTSCWLYVSLNQARVIQEEGTSAEKMSLPDRPLGKPMVHFSPWMVDMGRSNTLRVVPSLGWWSRLSKPQEANQ